MAGGIKTQQRRFTVANPPMQGTPEYAKWCTAVCKTAMFVRLAAMTHYGYDPINHPDTSGYCHEARFQMANKLASAVLRIIGFSQAQIASALGQPNSTTNIGRRLNSSIPLDADICAQITHKARRLLIIA